jgi:hypothetical protein
MMLDAMNTLAKMTQTTQSFLQSCSKYFTTLLDSRREGPIVDQPNATVRRKLGNHHWESCTFYSFLLILVTTTSRSLNKISEY